MGEAGGGASVVAGGVGGAEAGRPGGRAVAAWSLVQLALVLFSLNVVSLYFPLWVVDDMAAPDAAYALANGVAMAVIFVVAPFLGALSDQVPRRTPLLVATLLVCAVFTSLLGTGGLLASLVFFVVAVAAQQAATIFADALLPAVSTASTRGRVGGVGVAVGYLGAILGVGLGLVVLGLDPAGKPLLFRLTGALVLLFALPVVRWLPERPRPVTVLSGRRAVGQAWAALRQTVTRTRQAPGLARFLIGRAFYTDAANTLGAFMAIYASEEIGFGETQTQLLLLLGILGGIAGGLLCGRLVDRFGPKRMLNWLLVVQLVLFLAAAGIPSLSLPDALFWGVAPVAGFSIGGSWAADRPLMLRLTPPRYLGQFFGLYAMVGRFAAIVGPFLWAAIVDGLGWGRPVAVLSLATLTLTAIVILRPLDDAPRRWPDGETPLAADV